MREIERRVQKKWESEKIFEVDAPKSTQVSVCKCYLFDNNKFVCAHVYNNIMLCIFYFISCVGSR